MEGSKKIEALTRWVMIVCIIAGPALIAVSLWTIHWALATGFIGLFALIFGILIAIGMSKNDE